jgi:hypothetical protein
MSEKSFSALSKPDASVQNLKSILSNIESQRSLFDFIEASKGAEIPFFSKFKLEFLAEIANKETEEFLAWVKLFNVNETLEKEILVLRSTSINAETPNLLQDLEIIRGKLRAIGLREVGAESIPKTFLQLLNSVEILPEHPNMIRQLRTRFLLLHHEIESARKGSLETTSLIPPLERVTCKIGMPTEGVESITVFGVNQLGNLSFHELENFEKRLVSNLTHTCARSHAHAHARRPC